jgi:hypothetical protein
MSFVLEQLLGANVTSVDRVITTTPPNGDDAGAFTYTLQDCLKCVPGGTSLIRTDPYYRFSWYVYHNSNIINTRLCGD